MDKFINNQEFMAELFDDDEQAKRAGEIAATILEARSLRLTDIAMEMEGNWVIHLNPRANHPKFYALTTLRQPGF